MRRDNQGIAQAKRKIAARQSMDCASQKNKIAARQSGYCTCLFKICNAAIRVLRWPKENCGASINGLRQPKEQNSSAAIRVLRLPLQNLWQGNQGIAPASSKFAQGMGIAPNGWCKA
jgi:hypothetical protein